MPWSPLNSRNQASSPSQGFPNGTLRQGAGRGETPLHVAFAATAQMLTGSKQDVQGPGVACPPLPCEHLWSRGPGQAESWLPAGHLMGPFFTGSSQRHSCAPTSFLSRVSGTHPGLRVLTRHVQCSRLSGGSTINQFLLPSCFIAAASP